MPDPTGAGTISFTGEILVKMKAGANAGPQLLGGSPAFPGLAGGASPAIDTRGHTLAPASDLGRWHRVSVQAPGGGFLGPGQDQQQPLWDAVRATLRQPGVEYAEPEVEIEYHVPPEFSLDTGLTLDRDWHLGEPPGVRARAAWKLIADAGRKPGEGVIIAHLDTGYTAHPAVPADRFVSRGVDFWDPTRPDASDPLDSGVLLMPGHGTGTLCLLAADHPQYRGIATASGILPVRISPSVVHLRTSSLANGIVWACHQGAEVITISMGGLPSQLWADAVNYAYQQGVVICAAAGNNFVLPLGIRSPCRVVYPAKFNRVLGVAGVTFKELRYWTEKQGEMSGNFGPQVDIAAPTPDVLWAQPPAGYGPGAGTSTATPQVAGAAALWLSFHRAALAGFSPVEKVEACTHALLASARRAGPAPYGPGGKRHLQSNEYFGVGRLDIAAALGVAPVKGLPAQPEDSVRDLLSELFGMLDADAAAQGAQLERLWASCNRPEPVRPGP